MNADALKQLFPKASQAFLALNSSPEAPPRPKRRTLSAITQQDHANTQPAPITATNSPVSSRKASKLERDPGNGPLAKGGMRKPRKDIGSKRPRDKATCQKCGKEFFAPKSQGRKYCSSDCAYKSEERCAWIKPKERGQAVCKLCGTYFDITRVSGKAEFCSQPCAASFTGRGTVEKIRKNLFTPPSRGKSGWLEIGGKRFYARSTWEGNYARYLQFQKEHRLIKEWLHEPETFWFDGIKRGVCSYLPDFKVTKLDESIEFHEVKGWMDPRSITKIKRMAKYHPTIALRVIDAKAYKVLAKQLKNIIPGWVTGKNPSQAKIEVCQEKVGSKAEETTLIEIIPLEND